jgi:hypothetical protein
VQHNSTASMSTPVLLALAALALGLGCAESQQPSEQLRLTNPDAQVAFARGLLLHYGFYADEALAKFEKAAALDPKSPLPRWGIALALGPRTNDPDMAMRMARAFNEAQTAVALTKDRAGLAQDLSTAVAVRYTLATTFDPKALNRAYANAMSALAAKYPNDDDVVTLYA